MTLLLTFFGFKCKPEPPIPRLDQLLQPAYCAVPVRTPLSFLGLAYVLPWGGEGGMRSMPSLPHVQTPPPPSSLSLSKTWHVVNAENSLLQQLQRQ